MGLDFIEYEEQFGRFWHKLVGHRPSYPQYPGAIARLDDIRGPLATYFRAMGGDAALEIEAVLERSSGHRLTRLQRIVMTEEKLARATLTESTLLLPLSIDIFPQRKLNCDLYWWLAAFMAQLEGDEPADGFVGDIQRLARIERAQSQTLACFPGLRPLFAELAMAIWHVRPKRPLGTQESAVETVIERLHHGLSATSHLLALGRQPTPAKYRTFLPSPLWGQSESALAAADDPDDINDDDLQGHNGGQDEEKRHIAERREFENSERTDPLTMIVKGEWLLLADQMGDINRPDDDGDPDIAKKAADDFDEILLGKRSRKASSKISLALEAGRQGIDENPIRGGQCLYPEWHYRKKNYLRDHCHVSVEPVPESGEDWQPDDAARRRIRLVRRQFEALRPQRVTLRQQIDGTDLDIDALVRVRTDLATGGTGSDRIYLESRAIARNLSVGVLMDCSLSTDSYIEGRRVLDVEKEALTALAYGIDACGDCFAIHSFTSRRRKDIRIGLIKDFDQRLSQQIRQRIAALKPGSYTRMGAALRHETAIMKERTERHRLILLVTDGKPNDSDHYEGRFAIEDTRKAVIEARLAGIRVFAVTVDRRAESYVPFIFGRGGYAIVSHIGQLPDALPRLYRQVTAQ